MARLVSGSRFLVVGLLGILVNQTLLWILVEVGRLHYLFATVLATQGSTGFNFIWVELWVFSGRTKGNLLRRFFAFDALNSAALLLRLPLIFILTSGLHIHYLASNLITIGILTLGRFLISDGLIWLKPSVNRDTYLTTESTGSRPHRYTYNIANLISVVSDVQLPELQFFRTDSVSVPDLVIEKGLVGGVTPQPRVKLETHGSRVVYREHLGSLAANFEVDMGSPVRVRVGPLLALSPHVLYTNVVEALLRFLFVKKDRILLHAACLGLDGKGVLLSAKTDTGKTSTILRLLRQRRGTFLSDDMTIIDRDGMAYRYPKPLTISAHTLRAVPQNCLQLRQRATLYLQSRLHSRTGRTAGKRLAQANVPIMSINALVQAAVPPPKYMITDLVSCDIGRQVAINHFYIIERGEPRNLSRVPSHEAVAELLANTDDAYDFPPYAQLAPLLVLGGEDYRQLRRREQAILVSALRSVGVMRLRTPDFSWASLVAAQLSPNIPDPSDTASSLSAPVPSVGSSTAFNAVSKEPALNR